MAAARSARPVSAHRRGRLTAFVCASAMVLAFAAGFAGPAAAQFSESNPPYVGIPAPRNVPTASSKLEKVSPGVQPPERRPWWPKVS